MKIGAVILAAGEARRAGGPKAAWLVGGRPSVRRVAEAALGAAAVIETVAVAGGPWADAVKTALAGLPVKLADNPDYALGQSTSVRAGLKEVDSDARAAIFLLADQPFITSEIIDAMAAFMGRTLAPVVAPVLNGQRRNPALFNLGRFRRDLMNLKGDKGGRDIMKAAGDELALWPADGFDEKCFADFDTVDDYEGLK